MPKAVDKTNSKVDSIFEAASKPITIEQLNEGLLSLMNHMDTVQAAYFIAKMQADSIDNERYKESIKKINALDSIAKLQVKLSEAEAGAKHRDKAQNALIAFMGTFIGMVFFAGAVAGIRAAKRERAIIKSKDETE